MERWLISPLTSMEDMPEQQGLIWGLIKMKKVLACLLPLRSGWGGGGHCKATHSEGGSYE